MIPNVFHYTFGLSEEFSNKPFSLVHYLCIRSAYEINKPDKMHMWFEFVPDSPYFKKLESFVELHQISAPKEIYGRPLIHPAHRADVLRLQCLLEHGGVYLDVDVLCIRPYTDLLKREVVMGEQLTRGLCNATILSKPNTMFIRKWLESFKSFRSKGHDAYWDEHAVQMPKRIKRRYPSSVYVLPTTAFFYPLWWDIPKIMAPPDQDLTRDAYSIHLWETLCWDHYKDLTVSGLAESQSEFARLTKPFLEAAKL